MKLDTAPLTEDEIRAKIEARRRMHKFTASLVADWYPDSGPFKEHDREVRRENDLLEYESRLRYPYAYILQDWCDEMIRICDDGMRFNPFTFEYLKDRLAYERGRVAT